MAEKLSIKETVEKTAPARSAVSSMKQKARSKNENKKMISGYVDVKMYEKFQTINKNRGISNNAVLAMCIADYVKEHEYYLNE